MESKHSRIFVNNIANSMDVLFKNVDKCDVVIAGMPIFRPSTQTSIYEIPLKCISNDTRYNSKHRNIAIDASTMDRFLCEYINKEMTKLAKRPQEVLDIVFKRTPTGDVILDHTQDVIRYLIDKKFEANVGYFSKGNVSDEDKILVYSLSGFPEVSFKKKVHINCTDEALDGLFSDIDIIPATIRNKPRYNLNAPSLSKYSIAFEYCPNIDINYSGYKSHTYLSEDAINAFMIQMGVTDSRDLIGKYISVFAKYIPEKDSRTVCGISSYDRYVNR